MFYKMLIENFIFRHCCIPIFCTILKHDYTLAGFHVIHLAPPTRGLLNKLFWLPSSFLLYPSFHLIPPSPSWKVLPMGRYTCNTFNTAHGVSWPWQIMGKTFKKGVLYAKRGVIHKVKQPPKNIQQIKYKKNTVFFNREVG